LNAEDGEGKLMTKNPRRLGKVAAALGGILIMTGMIMTGIFALALFGILDISVFMDMKHLLLLTLVLLMIGIIDVVSGIILALG